MYHNSSTLVHEAVWSFVHTYLNYLCHIAATTRPTEYVKERARLCSGIANLRPCASEHIHHPNHGKCTVFLHDMVRDCFATNLARSLPGREQASEHHAAATSRPARCAAAPSTGSAPASRGPAAPAARAPPSAAAAQSGPCALTSSTCPAPHPPARHHPTLIISAHTLESWTGGTSTTSCFLGNSPKRIPCPLVPIIRGLEVVLPLLKSCPSAIAMFRGHVQYWNVAGSKVSGIPQGHSPPGRLLASRTFRSVDVRCRESENAKSFTSRHL